jgi:hypothetical protein
MFSTTKRINELRAQLDEQKKQTANWERHARKVEAKLAIAEQKLQNAQMYDEKLSDVVTQLFEDLRDSQARTTDKINRLQAWAAARGGELDAERQG